MRPLYGRRFMLDVLLDSYDEFLGRKPDSAPQIAIVDLKDRPTQKEFELFKEFFEQEGYPTGICSPEELEFENNRLRAGDFQIDIVYKRLLVNEYLPIISKQRRSNFFARAVFRSRPSDWRSCGQSRMSRILQPMQWPTSSGPRSGPSLFNRCTTPLLSWSMAA